MGMSIGHLIVILIIILVLFGAGRLPQVMSDLGRGIKAFRDSLKSDEEKKHNRDSE
jgi:sec-independent protein translocase protein TatA